MREIGYDQQLASSAAALNQGPVALAALLRRTADGQPAQLAYRLWLLAQWLSSEQAAQVFGPDLLERLLEWGLLAEVEGRVGATVDLYPVGGDYLATDRQIGLGRRLEAVYPPGIDSYSLRRMLPSFKVERALDLCTGSGIQALGLKADHTEAVDLSPRAAEFADFNFALNQPSRSRAIHQGALFEPLADRPYDLIVSNPPWVPTPDGEVELFRGGGLDGEFITRQIFEGAAQWLAPEGRLVVYVEYPHLKGQSYPERVRGWLGQGDWGIALVNMLHLSTEEYVAGQVASHTGQDIDREFERWMLGYERAGIEAMSRAVVYVVPGGPFEVCLEASHPTESQDWVGSWLENLGRSGTRLHSKAQLWTSGERARVEWPGSCLHPVELDPTEQAALTGQAGQFAVALRARMILE